MVIFKRSNHLIVPLLFTMLVSSIIVSAREGYADDWKSSEVIMTAVNHTISAEPNEKRNWNRLK